MGGREARARGRRGHRLCQDPSSRSDFDEAGDHDVFRKVKADLDAKGVDVSEHRLRRTMDELLTEAIASIKAEG